MARNQYHINDTYLRVDPKQCLDNLCYAIFAMQLFFMPSLLCSPGYVTFVMQSMLCNLCCAILVMLQSLLCNLGLLGATWGYLGLHGATWVYLWLPRIVGNLAVLLPGATWGLCETAWGYLR